MTATPAEQCSHTSILVVTVAYKSLAVMRDWYHLTADDTLTISVVDNYGEAGLPQLVESHGGRYIRSPGNVGFGRGCNIGADSGASYEWIALVNPDTSVTNDQLVELADSASPTAVAISPLLVDQTGNPHGDMYRRSPTPATSIVAWLLGSRAPLAKRVFAPIPNGSGTHPVEVTSGSCLLVRRDAWETVGGFPSWIFLNYEDVYLFRQLQRLGDIEVNSSVVVPHLKLSSATVVPSAQIRAETARALAIYTLSTSGRLAWLAVSVSVSLGFWMRYVRKPSQWRLAVRLLQTCLSEGLALLRDRPPLAGPVFIGRPDGQ